MKVRGERECVDCGTRWSYYETGSVACPDCGSVHSVGLDEERALQTDRPVELDVSGAIEAVDEEPPRRVAARAAEAAREYVRKRGFVSGGDLRPLDDTYLAAWELRQAAGAFERALDPGDDEELYLVSLLRVADDGDRPEPGDVPASMSQARGLAYGEAVHEYRREMGTWAAEHGVEGPGRDALELLGEHVKRVRAIDGDVEPATAERLVRAARDLATALRENDEDALARVHDRFDRLA